MRGFSIFLMIITIVKDCTSFNVESLTIWPTTYSISGQSLIDRQIVNSTKKKKPAAKIAQSYQEIQQSAHICPEKLGAQAISRNLCGGGGPAQRGYCGGENASLSHRRCLIVNPSNSSPLPHLTTITATDGAIGVETAAAVVLTGGIIWFLVGLTGEVAGESALETPKDAKKHPNDRKGPTPQHKCSDCAGSGNMCISGNDSGCGCENKSCPSGEAQPACSNAKCASKDNKKCSEEDAGCECKPKEECPTAWDMLSCDDCGGTEKKDVDETGQWGKCRGNPKEDNRFKDCECIIESGDECYPYGPLNTSELIANQKVLTNLPAVAKDSFSQTPSTSKAVCQKAGWVATQHETDGRPFDICLVQRNGW